MTDLTAQLTTALADRYRITRRLGEGGMATVYLADDLKHDRQVAVKVLRPELAAVLGADRFVQEIRTTARLQHPHILPLYDSGSTIAPGSPGMGFLYYVMPYIEGETLRAKLDREQQLGVDDAVRIASEVADALAYAHGQGVVHRDIKPENILLRDGRAYVADFGIALAVSAAAGGRMTETGLSLGTPHYMSPEQATADRHVTSRSDIYSLGSVLYELLTGEPPHTGASAQIIILKIVSDVARPVRELRKAVPAHVAAAVSTALEKLPADRFESATAFAKALHDPTFVGTATATVASGPTASAAGRPTPASGTRRLLVPALATVTFVALLVAAWAWQRSPAGTAATSIARFPTSLGTPGAVDGLAFAVNAALSPDGTMLVFRAPPTGRGPSLLYVKRRDEVQARPLAGTEGASGPFFSPDGAWIAFVANGQLRRIPAVGGTPLTLTDSVDETYNKGAWLDDGSIVFYDVGTHTLRRLAAGEARARVIVTPERLGRRYPWLPSPLPTSRGILFTAHLTQCVGPVSCRPSRVYVWDARTDSIRMLFEDAIGAWHVPTGHVLYLTSAGTLMAVPWDNEALTATGKPVAIMDGIQAPSFLVSNEGTAYYLLGPSEFAPGPVPNAQVVWVDRSGRVEPVDSSWQVNTGGTDNGSIGTDWGLTLSRDGRRLALSLLTETGTDVWVKPLPVGPATRLTLHGGVDRVPAFTPDGGAVTFLSDRATTTATTTASQSAAAAFSVWEQSVDGTGDAVLLSRTPGVAHAARTPDGRWLVLGAAAAGGRAGIVVATPGADSAARRLDSPTADMRAAVVSPDSRFIAYISNEQGVDEVFVRPFPDVERGKWQVSSGGGSAPLWSRSGRELFYVAGRTMYVVRIDPGAPFAPAPPRPLFSIPPNVRAGALVSGTMAIAPDDQRFLMVRDNRWEDMAGTPQLVVLQGLFAELRAKVPR